METVTLWLTPAMMSESIDHIDNVLHRNAFLVKLYQNTYQNVFAIPIPIHGVLCKQCEQIWRFIAIWGNFL